MSFELQFPESLVYRRGESKCKFYRECSVWGRRQEDHVARFLHRKRERL